MFIFALLFIGCSVVFLLVFCAFVKMFLVITTVENHSMSPALEHGDRVLALRYWPKKWLYNGQIVLIWPWRASSSSPNIFEVVPYIKRVVGLPGETIVTYASDLPEFDRPSNLKAYDNSGRRFWYIQYGHFFVRGDNSTRSIDSRFWGPISIDSLLGVVLMKLPRKAPSTSNNNQNIVHHPRRREGLSVGQLAPTFSTQMLHGNTTTLSSYIGHVTAFLFIIPTNFCQKYIYDYEALALKAAQSGVELVLVSAANMTRTLAFFDTRTVTLPILVAPYETNPFMKDYNIVGVPFYCLVDERGVIQSNGYPSLDWGEWKTLVEVWEHTQTAKGGLSVVREKG